MFSHIYELKESTVMNAVRYRILVFLVLLTACLAPVAGKDKTPLATAGKLSIDGPYLLKADDGSRRVISVDRKGRLSDKRYASLPASFSFDVFADNGERLFPVTLHPVSRPAWKDERAERTFVISDPHANWACFASLLKAGKVIDKEYKWIFGSNQLVIIGDVFDRGVDVLPIFWLIYKLEKEAEDAGGKVSFLIGNHETMVLGNDLRYTKKKYTQLADTLGMTYPELWRDSELGAWLKTRNSIQVIGDNLFVHAGLSKAFLDRNYDIPTVNEIVSDGLFLTKPERNEDKTSDLSFMFATYGPIWYRGMVHSADRYHPLDRDDLKTILEKYGVSRVFVGHTIFDTITTFYQYKVIAMNVDNEENMEKQRGRGIMIKRDGSILVVFDSGKMEPLIKE